MSSQDQPAPTIMTPAELLGEILYLADALETGDEGKPWHKRALAAVEAYTAAIRQDEREKVADMLLYWDIVTREQSRAIKGEGLDD